MSVKCYNCNTWIGKQGDHRSFNPRLVVYGKRWTCYPWDNDGWIIGTNKSNLAKYIKPNKVYTLKTRKVGKATLCKLYEEIDD